MKTTYFATPALFRRWFKKNHRSATELWVGFYKKSTGKPSITWPESVDQALCFGWIDGVRKSFGEECYVIRFSPRKPGSIWSTVNTRRARQLNKLGLMHAAGMKAFVARDEKRSGVYSFEREKAALPTEYEQQLRANPAAWDFFQVQPPGYRKLVAWWVISAKQESTRQRRLVTLIADSKKGLRVKTQRL